MTAVASHRSELFTKSEQVCFVSRDRLSAVNHLFLLLESVERMFFSTSHSQDNPESRGLFSVPVDILDAPKEYIFYFDVPGISKSNIQVTVEDENILVVRGKGKRKRKEGEDEGCKYLRMERKSSPKFLRKFRLPDNSNTSAISAKCENGVLTITVEKLPPPPKAKTREVTVS
ncbi:17.4 kDa class III heat shock protein-like [Aristolochia californica]|uniref:17.4 kDa class III heat shock protein-like n=1 Tax=Aristolochia californica TaxID=171875 RepID=UPI0035DA1800